MDPHKLILNNIIGMRTASNYFKEESKMNKNQENKILKGIYNEAIKMMIEAVEDRPRAIYNYESYLETIEGTIQVFNPSFNLERDLKLVPRGLNEDILRYVTRLDYQSQREQLIFYQEIRESL